QQPHAAGDHHHANAGKHHPPGDHVQQSVHPFAVPEAHIDVYQLAKEQLDTADDHGDNHDLHGVVDGVYDDAFGEGSHPTGHGHAGQEHVVDDVQGVTKEAAHKNTHKCGGY